MLPLAVIYVAVTRFMETSVVLTEPAHVGTVLANSVMPSAVRPSIFLRLVFMMSFSFLRSYSCFISAFAVSSIYGWIMA
jgi:hypothetical protein